MRSTGCLALTRRRLFLLVRPLDLAQLDDSRSSPISRFPNHDLDAGLAQARRSCTYSAGSPLLLYGFFRLEKRNYLV
jgi:hypothetical protein